MDTTKDHFTQRNEVRNSIEVLPGVLGNRGTRAFFSKEQGNKGLKIRGSGEQRQFGGTGNIENQDFVLGKHRNKAIFSRGTREQVPPCEGLSIRRMKYLELAFTKK